MLNVNPSALVTTAEKVGVRPVANSTAKEKAFAELPAAFLAVMVYDDRLETAVGVPEISPVEVLRLNPAGSDGDIEYEDAASPLLLIEYKPLTAVLVDAVPEVSDNEIFGADIGCTITMVRPRDAILVDGKVKFVMFPSERRIMLTPPLVTA